MIAIKNLQNVSNLLLQEEVLQAVAGDYVNRVKNKDLSKMLESFVHKSRARHAELYKYLEGHK